MEEFPDPTPVGMDDLTDSQISKLYAEIEGMRLLKARFERKFYTLPAQKGVVSGGCGGPLLETLAERVVRLVMERYQRESAATQAEIYTRSREFLKEVYPEVYKESLSQEAKLQHIRKWASGLVQKGVLVNTPEYREERRKFKELTGYREV